MWWFLLYEDGPQISYYQLTHWMRCEIEPENFADLDCAVFEDTHPNALALSVLVTIEMANAVNRYALTTCYTILISSTLKGSMAKWLKRSTVTCKVQFRLLCKFHLCQMGIVNCC